MQDNEENRGQVAVGVPIAAAPNDERTCAKCGKFMGAYYGMCYVVHPPSSPEEEEFMRKQAGPFYGKEYRLCVECTFKLIGATPETAHTIF